MFINFSHGEFVKYILVVEDEEDILETIVDTIEIELSHQELKIDSALNGSIALEKFLAFKEYDLVITDLNMPKMNGLELIKIISSERSETPVLVFTGHGDTEEYNELISHGVKAMVKKPYIEDLIVEIKNIIK
jgi:DNA-binding NtrC family response regulator